MGWNDHIDDGRGPSPPIYIDGIIAMLKKRRLDRRQDFYSLDRHGRVTRWRMPLHKSRWRAWRRDNSVLSEIWIALLRGGFCA